MKLNKILSCVCTVILSTCLISTQAYGSKLNDKAFENAIKGNKIIDKHHSLSDDAVIAAAAFTGRSYSSIRKEGVHHLGTGVSPVILTNTTQPFPLTVSIA
ncbi:hypothetical protein AGMMS49921_08610 [Endomicrobiia bacterium]|nr:hypothetical protein AGMMS49921_08610 [Endomicrobiia bacterium]